MEVNARNIMRLHSHDWQDTGPVESFKLCGVVGGIDREIESAADP